MGETATITSLAAGLAMSALLLVAGLALTARHLASRYNDAVLDVTSAKLSELFIFVDSRFLLKTSIAATLILPALLLLLTRNGLLVAIAAALCLVGPRIVQRRLRQRRRMELIRQLPDTLDSLVGGLRAGMSLPQALGLLSEQLPKPSSQEFALTVRKLRIGVPLDEALQELEQRVQSQEYTMFTTSVRISREVGGNLTESLERLADTMRKKLAMEGKIDALTSQGKLQGLVVGALPLAMMWILNVVEPVAMAPLFNTWAGYGVLTIIFFLELIGFVLIRKIVRIDV